MAAKSNKGKASREKTATKKPKTTISHEEIARQAYMLWVEKGGDQLSNWLEAERRLR